MGYGLLEGEEEPLMVMDFGVLSTSPTIPMAERLHRLYSELANLIAHHQPSEVVVEGSFMARNVRSALAIGQAQAVAILAASTQGIFIYTYTPAQVKQAVTGYGRSEKEQVQEMVRIQLGLSSPPQPSDAADALAIALCHARQRHFDKLLAGVEVE
jgi:crossover junction endodeoxyribonuclease RuvC